MDMVVVTAEDGADMVAVMEEEVVMTAEVRGLPVVVVVARLEEEKAPAKAQPDNDDDRGRQPGIVQQGPCH